MFHGDSINSTASFQYIAEEARSPLRPWLMELWGEAHTSCRLGRQPCCAVPVEEARPGVEAGSFGPTSLRAVSHFILWISRRHSLILWAGLEPEADKGAYWMSLYLGHPFWEVLVNLPCQQSWATLWSAFHALCTQLMLLDQGLPSAVFFWKHWHSLSLPSC